MSIIRCQVGETTTIWHPDVVNLYDCTIGEACNIGAFVEIGKGVTIGNGCSIGAYAFIPQGVDIGNDVFVGPGVVFCNDKYPPSRGAWKIMHTVVEDGVSIGARALILPGITLHAGCKIGAGAVVTRDVAAGKTVVGNPARPLD